ncbi:long-chain-fatty-acid--CoA ligase [Bacillus sp. DNRA2]|uniref:long-chain-fatty-acid--CoA ligase n=1 Tax=Bacillus sp. DNRA2 TaxID=2723053 RepID=UPI00145CA3CF|nr:long-chain-fatty-acid--CoA ligase [Bacillus sp. DNRA2]NMD69286.1 long-chain-fatty-acid--CoA ligase [Bacillus sp. DNRA2]
MSWNLSENLKRIANGFPDRIVYQFMDQSTTYAELDFLVDRFAAALAKEGIGKGDAVALLLGNTPHFVIAYYGILRSGAAAVPINPIFSPREIEYILVNSEAKAVISIPQLQLVLSALKQKLNHLGLVVYTDQLDSEWNFDQFVRIANLNFISPVIEKDDLAVILYTSGTTGDPKGAMLTHLNMGSNAQACTKLFELTHEDRIITVLPIFHVFCMTVCMNATITCSATMVLMPKFSPTEVVKTIKEQQATIFVGVPTMYNFLLQVPNATLEDFQSIRSCVSGGAPLPVALLHKFEQKYQVKIMEGYGLSEASPVTAFNPIHGVRKPGSIGIDIPYVTNKVVDPYGQEVPRGEIGELIVQGPNVMKGYLGMPEATEIALRDGWLYTGDMARMDEDGYLYIVDRKKDMILVGGYNVYPREVEEVLYEHPAIVETAVIGVPDPEYGEAVKAFVVCEGVSLTEADLIDYCSGKIAKYKIPKSIVFVDELPKNTTGKILRRMLQS